ncbi:hypothetical protein ACHAXA_010277 [Cyclostephanos tholiformis]|uniref:Uncharacterized protein n=1 Tax=Cyclostephanos tholiformis TaxID=382380 RepID=A0ABD3RKF8_9STRA
MARLSMPDTPVDGSNIYRLLNNSLCSSVASSADPGSEDYLSGVTSETSGKSNGGLEEGTDLFASSVTKGVTDRGWVASPGATTKNKVKTTGATTQAPPSNHYEQQYPYGYQVPGYPQGMMPVDPGMAPPGMMPMQPGTLPPGMMPYMMPPPYYGCSPFRDLLRLHMWTPGNKDCHRREQG